MQQVQINETKRSDIYRIDPRNVKIQEGFNIRQIESDADDIALLMESIRENGVRRPIVVKSNQNKEQDGMEYVCVDGHRRLTAVMNLIEQGEEIAYVKAEMVKGMNEEDAVLSMFILNDGKPLSPIEKAEGVRRLIDVYGYSNIEVAKKIGESGATISNLLMLSKMPKSVKRKIAANIISSTLALEVARSSESEEEFTKKIEELCGGDKVENTDKKKKGKRAKITAKKAKGIVKEKNVVKVLEIAVEQVKSHENEKLATFFCDIVEFLKTKPTPESIVTWFNQKANDI